MALYCVLRSTEYIVVRDLFFGIPYDVSRHQKSCRFLLSLLRNLGTAVIL
ncbi:unnamed protein product [Penicillium camemberti]|uniref:Str. FM013 n=1 Tax=Penicillium camemberti (strain FM 013) TaxID=1429867 RepID=A0A0G4PLE7_PENC3|nr:unnamed protein product [Penicillium camemberti]